MKVTKSVTEITGQNGFPTKGTLPTGRTLTGTYSSVGTVVTGTGTKFISELGAVKGWLYSTTDNELRSFIQTNKDDVLELEKAFTNNQTNQPMIVCFPLYVSIAAKSSDPSIPANFNNRTFSAGSTENINFHGGIEPVTYDAASGSNMGQITFYLGY